jgi:DNA polymerase-3 subunit delta'
MGRWKVFIIGGAERLAAQAANPEAANALLKALEEPPADTVVILAAAEPKALPATILSRVVRVRVAPVQDSVVTEFAHRELGLNTQRDVEQRVRLAEGRIGRLLAPSGERATGTGKLADTFLGAVRRGPAARFALALAQQPFQARGGFTALLDDLLEQLRHEARAGGDSGKVVAAMAHVLGARELAQGNVNPQLLTAVLADELGA